MLSARLPLLPSASTWAWRQCQGCLSSSTHPVSRPDLATGIAAGAPRGPAPGSDQGRGSNEMAGDCLAGHQLQAPGELQRPGFSAQPEQWPAATMR